MFDPDDLFIFLAEGIAADYYLLMGSDEYNLQQTYSSTPPLHLDTDLHSLPAMEDTLSVYLPSGRSQAPPTN